VRGWLLVIVGLAGCRGFFDVPPVSPDAAPDAPGVPIAYVQSAASSITSASSVTVGFPLAETAGNANLIVIGWSPGSLVSMNDSRANHYMAATGPMQAGDGWTQQIFLATDVAGGADTVNVTFNTGQVYAHLGIFEYSGIAGVDQSVGAIGTASSRPGTPALATSSAPDLLFAALSAQNAINTTIVQSYTSRLSGSEYLIADQEATTAGSYAAMTSAVPQADWVMQLLALRAQ
jgi:hypothetical protein